MTHEKCFVNVLAAPVILNGKNSSLYTPEVTQNIVFAVHIAAQVGTFPTLHAHNQAFEARAECFSTKREDLFRVRYSFPSKRVISIKKVCDRDTFDSYH